MSYWMNNWPSIEEFLELLSLDPVPPGNEVSEGNMAVHTSQVQCVCDGKWLSISVRVGLRHKG